jgi:hypothetical protein
LEEVGGGKNTGGSAGLIKQTRKWTSYAEIKGMTQEKKRFRHQKNHLRIINYRDRVQNRTITLGDRFQKIS